MIMIRMPGCYICMQGVLRGHGRAVRASADA